MSCRSTAGSSACVSLACLTHGLEDAQVQSILHDAIHAARDAGERAGVDDYHRFLAGQVRRLAERTDIPPRQAASLAARFAAGRRAPEIPADEARRAALISLDDRVHLARRHLAGYLDDAAVRYGEPTETVTDRYHQFRAEAVADRTRRAPDTFVTGLREGAFTWGVPRDRATAYALYRLAHGVGYRPPAGGRARCAACGEFTGAGHTCPVGETAPGSSSCDYQIVGGAPATDGGDNGGDTASPRDRGYEAVIPHGGETVPVVDAVGDPAVRAVYTHIRDLPVSPPLPDGPAGGSLADDVDTFTRFDDTYRRFAAAVNDLEDDLAARLDEAGLCSLHDQMTGVTVRPVGGVRYSQWDKDAAVRDITDRLAAADPDLPEATDRVLTAYLTYAQVDGFRARGLRDLGLRPGDYATSQPDRRAVEVDDQSAGADPVVGAAPTAADFDRLVREVDGLAEARQRLRTGPLGEAVRCHVTVRTAQRHLAALRRAAEDRLITRMRDEQVQSIPGPDGTVGTVHLPQRTRVWDRPAALAAVTAAIAGRVDVPVDVADRIVQRFTRTAVVSGYRMRRLPDLGVDPNDYSEIRIPRPRIRWASPEPPIAGLGDNSLASDVPTIR